MLFRYVTIAVRERWNELCVIKKTEKQLATKSFENVGF